MSTLASAWVLTRKDGERLGFTDHDGPLEVDGVTCRPQSGFTPTAAQSQLGFGHDNSELQGVLDDARLSPELIASGAYDGARIFEWAVDWTASVPPRLRRTLRIRSITHDSARRFTAEVVGLGAELETLTGRLVSRLCAARFGDARCGIEAAAHAQGTSCARTFSACRAFANTENFRGFPHLIGDDALVQGVSDTLPRDGGSRYTHRTDV